MKSAEFEARTRVINKQVYGVYLISCIVALVLCPLVVIVTQRFTDSQAAVFGYGLAAAALTIGVPLFFVLRWAEGQQSRLNVEAREEAAAENFLQLQQFIHQHNKEATSDEEQDEDVRSGDAEHT